MSDGAHVPVLLEEAVAALDVRADGTYVDATFGRGGHARRILGLLGPAGRLVRAPGRAQRGAQLPALALPRGVGAELLRTRVDNHRPARY